MPPPSSDHPHQVHTARPTRLVQPLPVMTAFGGKNLERHWPRISPCHRFLEVHTPKSRPQRVFAEIPHPYHLAATTTLTQHHPTAVFPFKYRR